MNVSIRIKNATLDDMQWVNNTYSSIGFTHSDFSNEFIVIAETDQQKCGVGRLVFINNIHKELGGIFVAKKYRGLGIAKKIVLRLLQEKSKGQKIWCLPFKHLFPFYKQCNFILYDHKTQRDVPQSILDKHQWCNKTYDQKVLLLVQE
ncbi:GNAT family N-acetyltransferase [Aquimarina sp. TRL1]|uniref:GNAT family N-acetyltransferase n=1 Tax=Aquimarina sp. (strain TRL1) TaxID=2736252 RepID=UPI00158B63B0|nr:GNAT family N-acetyltransferase [Aquimarina sp. TRL1]QKX06391.1 GNAT family N-acetyltransferase [Aquimarina sp. TRL1]